MMPLAAVPDWTPSACLLCGARVASIDVWPAPYGNGAIIVGDCPEHGPEAPVQFVNPIDAQPIPQIEITTGPQAA